MRRPNSCAGWAHEIELKRVKLGRFVPFCFCSIDQLIKDPNRGSMPTQRNAEALLGRPP